MELASRFLSTGPTGKLLNQDFLSKEQFPLCPDHRRCVRSQASSELGGGVTKTLSRVWLLRPHGLKPARLLCPWDSPGKNTRVDRHFFLQEIFLTQGSKLCHLRLLHCRQILYHLNDKGSPMRTTVKCKCVYVYNCNSSRYSLKSANDYSKDTKIMDLNLWM